MTSHTLAPRQLSPVHVSTLTPAQSGRLGALAATWDGPLVDPCGYLAHDDLMAAIA